MYGRRAYRRENNERIARETKNKDHYAGTLQRRLIDAINDNNVEAVKLLICEDEHIPLLKLILIYAVDSDKKNKSIELTRVLLYKRSNNNFSISDVQEVIENYYTQGRSKSSDLLDIMEGYVSEQKMRTKSAVRN